jgi:hypothetical protein
MAMKSLALSSLSVKCFWAVYVAALTGLSTDHPVHRLNALLSHLKNETIQL